MRLSGTRVAILLAEGVEDLEFYVPMMRLQEEGADVVAAAMDLKPVRGKHGLEITPNVRIFSTAQPISSRSSRRSAVSKSSPPSTPPPGSLW